MIIDRFVGFVAKVVNVNGEDTNFGKVKIRIVGDQGDSVISDDDLLWSNIMMPVTSPAERGIGTTPNWLFVGSTVFGVFLDGNYRNIPLIIGSINQNKAIGPGISPLASGELIPREYTAFEKEFGVEEARRPNYDDNKVITTASKETPETINHIIELDDTQQAERILVKHKNGSYVEFLPNGTVMVKGTEAFAAVSKQLKLRALIGMLLKSDGNADITADKNINITAEDSITIKGKTITLEADTINMSGNTVFNGDVSIVGDSVNIAASTISVVGVMTLNGRPVKTT
jgi:hypothetical protein